MKIIQPPGSTRVPEPAAAAPALAPKPASASAQPDREAEQRAAEREKEIQHTLDVFKAQIGTLHEELEQLNAAREKEETDRQRDARTIQALSEEIASLRKSVLESQKPKPEPVIPVPPSSPAASSRGSMDSPLTTAGNDVRATPTPVPPSSPVVNDVRPPAPAAALNFDLPSEKNEGKVALLSKLWDYLNHVAVEVPLRKPDRND